VEVARVGDAAAVRDSTHPDQWLRFSTPDWNRFLAAVRAGVFQPR